MTNPTKQSQQISCLDRVREVLHFLSIYKIRPCPRGNGCRGCERQICPFLHEGEESRRDWSKKIWYDARLCTPYSEGRCLYGEACGSAHGILEFNFHPFVYQTRMCADAIECDSTFYCPFAHNEGELRDVYEFVESDDFLENAVFMVIDMMNRDQRDPSSTLTLAASTPVPDVYELFKKFGNHISPILRKIDGLSDYLTLLTMNTLELQNLQGERFLPCSSMADQSEESVEKKFNASSSPGPGFFFLTEQSDQATRSHRLAAEPTEGGHNPNEESGSLQSCSSMSSPFQESIQKTDAGLDGVRIPGDLYEAYGRRSVNPSEVENSHGQGSVGYSSFSQNFNASSTSDRRMSYKYFRRMIRQSPTEQPNLLGPISGYLNIQDQEEPEASADGDLPKLN